jgi:hypothetical protein
VLQRQNRVHRSPHQHQQVRKKLWKMECPPKVLHFLWRFCHNSHPLYMRKGIVLDTRCSVCSRYFEDGGHLFFRCKEVKKMWRAINMQEERARLSECLNPLEIMHRLQSLPGDQSMQGVALLWCWWQERNKVNHQECRLYL